MKICSKCHLGKDEINFGKLTASPDGFRSICKDCRKLIRETDEQRLKRSIRRKKNYQKNKIREKEKQRSWWCLRTYGITIEQRNELLFKQESKCLICFKILHEGDRDCHYDHDHITGKFRGFLCQKCNNGLGIFNDEITLLQSAINYLQKN